MIAVLETLISRNQSRLHIQAATVVKDCSWRIAGTASESYCMQCIHHVGCFSRQFDYNNWIPYWPAARQDWNLRFAGFATIQADCVLEIISFKRCDATSIVKVLPWCLRGVVQFAFRIYTLTFLPFPSAHCTICSQNLIRDSSHIPLKSSV